MGSNFKLKNNNSTELNIQHVDNAPAVSLTSTDLSKVIPIDTIALLRAKTVTPSTVWVSGYYAKGDGAFGSNIFEWDSTSTETDNGGTIIKLTSITTGRYKLRFSGTINAKWFGSKGDGVANDTITLYKAIEAGVAGGYLVFFPNGVYLCNLSLSAENSKSGKYNWEGESQSGTIFKSYDGATDAIKWNISNYLLRCSFKKFTVSGKNGATNRAWSGKAIHYSVFTECTFTDAFIGYESLCFGNTYNSCDFKGIYGYLGIATSTFYDGWNNFEGSCTFKGEKVAYFVDNRNAPMNIGNGSRHNASDWESFNGLAIYVSGNSSQPDVFNNIWLEAVGTSGTVDLSDIPTVGGLIGVVSIPESSIIIADPALKTSKAIFNGVCDGATITGDANINIDILRGKVDYSTSNKVKVNVNTYDKYLGGVTESSPKNLDIYQNGTRMMIGGVTPHKTNIISDSTFNNSILNWALYGSEGFTIIGVGTKKVVNNCGVLLGRSLLITLSAGAALQISGTEQYGRLVNYGKPSCFSFALKNQTAIDTKTLNIGYYLYTKDTFVSLGDVKSEQYWKTYTFMNTLDAIYLGIKNNTNEDISFYITDMQFVIPSNETVLSGGFIQAFKNFSATDSYCGIGKSEYSTTVATTSNYIYRRKAKYCIEENSLQYIQSVLSYKDRFSLLPLGERSLISDIVNNGDFSNWEGSLPSGWSSTGTPTILKETNDYETGTHSISIRSSSYSNMLTANILNSLLSNGIIRVTARVKCVSSSGSIYLAKSTAVAGRVLLSDNSINNNTWSWVDIFVDLRGTSLSIVTDNSVWLIDAIYISSYDDKFDASKY